MIGVFDSGYGGLTIFHELTKTFPEYSFTYLGDNARAPYGDKTVEEITEYTRRGVEELFNRGCVLVILGCNTASAVALRTLQQTWLPAHFPDRKLLGIVVPTIEQITGGEASSYVGVLATQRTIDSGAYEQEIQKRNPNITVFQTACNNLAGAIEQKGANSNEVKQEARRCVEQLISPPAGGGARGGGSFSAVLLGCTHYELIADTIASALPTGTPLFHQPTIVAKSLQEYLTRHADIQSRITKEGARTYLTTGNADEVTRHSQEFLGEEVKFVGI